MKEMIKRKVAYWGTKNKCVYISLHGKDGETIYEAALPKDKVKVTNFEKGFGGAMSVDIEFPKELSSLFKKMY